MARLSAALTSVVFLFLIAFSASSAPLRNVPVTVKQPNGDVIQCFASGDEFFNWLHDARGHVIIQDHANGNYVYAAQVNDEIVPTESIVGKGVPANALLQTRMTPPRQRIEKARAELAGGSPANPQQILPAPSNGTINNLVIFIRFSGEAEWTDLISKYSGLFNTATAGANSMRNYYQEVSYGQLTVSTTFYPTPPGATVVSYQDSHPRGYYQPYDATTNPTGYQSETERRNREHTLLVNAVNAVSSQVPAGLNIDGDSDGNVDNVCFIIDGSPTGWNSLLWPHMWSLYSQTVYINGKRVYTYNFQLQAPLDTSGVGVLCHEMFHSLGSPDLYHYSYDGLQPVYQWDIMENDLNPPQHMGAYMKHRYGAWISSIPVITAPGTYTLNPLTSSSTNCYRINSPNSSTEYFVVEYRRKTGTFESSLPGSGLLVYRINSACDGQGNADGPPDEVYIYRPSGTLTADGDPSKANYSSDVGRTAISNSTNPSSFLSGGGPGGLVISEVSQAGANITFTFGVATATPGMAKTTGANNNGQAGLADTNNRNVFTPAPGPTTLVALAAGQAHSLALKRDGTVWACGWNVSGQLGLADYGDRRSFVQVPGLTSVVSVAGGWLHSLASKSNRTVSACGGNQYGQLGLGDNAVRTSFTQVGSLSDITAVAAGSWHTLALQSDGTVWACGYNRYGQLGLGDNTDRNTFTHVTGLTGVVAVACGWSDSLALKSDGTVWTTGYNASGQLGLGNNADRKTFTMVTGLSGVVAVAGGGFHSLALKSNGTLWTCGENRYGQLGLGDATDRNTFTQVPVLTRIIAVAGGGFHSLAQKNDGTVWACGLNASGQLGLGDWTDRNTLTAVPGISAVLAAGGAHSLAISGSAPTARMYKMDGFGGVHAVGGAPAFTGGPYWKGWDIANDLAVVADSTGAVKGYYVLDGWGGVWPVGNVPAFTGGPYWRGWDIARALKVVSTSAGTVKGYYVLDGFGGVHPVGNVPALASGPYWPGWDIARDLDVVFDSNGNVKGCYVLDGLGGVHRVGSVANFSGSAYFGWDIARAIRAVYDSNGMVKGWYVLDGFGAVHRAGNVPTFTGGPYWKGSDIAKTLSVITNSAGDVSGYYVLDGFGGVHAVGSVLLSSSSPYWGGWNIARSLGVVRSSQGQPR